jgi:hypothetical protein
MTAMATVATVMRVVATMTTTMMITMTATTTIKTVTGEMMMAMATVATAVARTTR